jgi:hypothetical protein|tara:strand:+ start:513 stop:662 length:150 start_codon:yes stop_codon:yes gene_type:complete
MTLEDLEYLKVAIEFSIEKCETQYTETHYNLMHNSLNLIDEEINNLKDL